MSYKLIFRILVLVTAFFSGSVWAEAEPAKAKNQSNIAAAERAQKLLQRAVNHYQRNADLALAAFSRAGEFIDGEFYVYVLSLQGTMLASGGSSSALIGRDVTNMVDATGKLFFREMIAGAQAAGSGQVEYRWLNRVDSKVEKKLTYYQRVGDNILAVGFYVPHASLEQAKKLLGDAVQAITADPEKAFAAFNNPKGQFIQDDLYVFAVGMADGRFRAHGATPRLIGSNALVLKDPKGKTIVQDMINLVKIKREGQYDYVWKNSVTHRIEPKHTFVYKAGDYLVGVGYYTE
jgi:cytochrome c